MSDVENRRMGRFSVGLSYMMFEHMGTVIANDVDRDERSRTGKEEGG